MTHLSSHPHDDSMPRSDQSMIVAPRTPHFIAFSDPFRPVVKTSSVTREYRADLGLQLY